MRPRVFLLLCVTFATLPTSVLPAADLTKVPRTIGKEPVYQSKSPKYGLLVFGPKVDQRVWLVLDGDVLYVDANGNGDLTEPGERVGLKAQNREPAEFPEVSLSAAGGAKLECWVWGWFDFKHGRHGKTDSLEPSLSVKWNGKSYGAWGDQDSRLVFAARPQDAPILHVGGPLTMGFEVRQESGLRRTDEKTFELKVGVGTPGLGKGSFVHLKYWHNAIPEKVQPTVELELPSKEPGGPAIKVTQVLKERC